MGMSGCLHRVPAERFTELLANPDEISRALLDPEDDLQRFPDCTVEKTWCAIEFILGRLIETDHIPWTAPLIGGEEVCDSSGFWCLYRTPEEVEEIAGVLAGLSKDEFKSAYSPEEMTDVYPLGFWDQTEVAVLNFDYVWAWYSDMVDFYREAAAKGEGVFLYLA